jgi:hypothetical protein
MTLLAPGLAARERLPRSTRWGAPLSGALRLA